MSTFTESKHIRGGNTNNVGQFSHKTLLAPDIDLQDDTVSVDAVNRLLEAAKEPQTLVYVSYDERLSNEQLTQYLGGSLDEVEDSLNEAHEDTREVSIKERFREILNAADVEEFDLGEEQIEEIKDNIRDSDDSNPLPDLLRHAGDQLMRVEIGRVPHDWDDGNGQPPIERRAKAISDMLVKRGVDVTSEANRAAIEELVTEGPYQWHEGVTLEVIWFGSPKDATVWNDDAGECSPRTLKFTQPHILLIDRWNGSGHEVQLSGPIATEVTTSEPAFMDADAHGYGWDDVAGVVHSAYRTDVNAEWKI